MFSLFVTPLGFAPSGPAACRSASRSQSWDFDALGNFDSQTTDGTAQTRSHNKQNEITSVSSATTPTYDASGDMTGDETGKQFVYDAWGRFVVVKDSGGSTLATYRYDGLNRRVRETISGTTTDLYYSSAWQVLEEDVSGTAKTSYVWSPVSVDALIARDRDADGNSGNGLEERLYAMQDANFNVTGLLNTNGAAQERYLYDPYGSVTYLTGTWGSRSSSSYNWIANFQGLRVDAVANGINDRNREELPTLGREGRLDPIGLEASDADMYRYVANNPLNVSDPSGLIGFGPIVGGSYDAGIGLGGSSGMVFAGIGHFLDLRKPFPFGGSTGAFAGGGYYAGPSLPGLGGCWGSPSRLGAAGPGGFTLGAGASVGINGFFFTNADDVSELGGLFNNVNFTLPFVGRFVSINVSIGFDPTSNVFIVSVIPSIGYGTPSFSIYPTDTVTGRICTWW